MLMIEIWWPEIIEVMFFFLNKETKKQLFAKIKQKQRKKSYL
jgi:hypothetical protein